jgi:hypothetical protein
MQNRTFKQLISSLLIASPLWWTCGCYATREVTKLSEALGSEIEVVTMGNHVYNFTIWTSDGFGGISGEAEWLVPPSDSLPLVYTKRHLTLPIDSIKSVSTKASSTAGNWLVLTFITATIVVGLLLLSRPPALTFRSL